MIHCTEHRWRTLWQRIGAQGDGWRCYNELVACYASPHRAYHTLEHIDHCLAEFDDVRHLALHPNALEVAIWYHDAVYDPQAEDNEEQSMALITELAKRDVLSDDFRHQVAKLIRVTTYGEFPLEPDDQLMTDIDLAILGQSEPVFDLYEYHIRLEYEFFSDKEFAAERWKILCSFLRRPAIYSTRFFHEAYDAPARKNLDRSLQKLRRYL